MKLKFVMLRFLRYHALFPDSTDEASLQLAPLAIRFILNDCQKLGVMVGVDDYKQIYQYLLATTDKDNNDH